MGCVRGCGGVVFPIPHRQDGKLLCVCLESGHESESDSESESARARARAREIQHIFGVCV